MNNISFVGEHPRTYSVHPHAHDHWELVYCTSGSGSFTFRDGVTVSYAQGDMVAIPPRTVHANVSQEGFTNIHLIMDEPTFPYHHMFKIADDSDGRIRMAFEQARYYYLADIRKRAAWLRSSQLARSASHGTKLTAVLHTWGST